MPAQRNKKIRLVNLLPKEDFDRTTLGRILKWALTSFRFIVIFVEFVVIIGFLSRFWLDVQISDLDEEINQKSALISSRAPFETQFRNTQKKLNMLAEITKDSHNASPFMEITISKLPADTQLISFTKTGSEIEVKGASISENSIGSFMESLAKEPTFKNVTLTRVESRAENPLIEFTIQATVSEAVNS